MADLTFGGLFGDAFLLMVAITEGATTTRRVQETLGWSRSKVQREVAQLVRAGIATREPTLALDTRRRMWPTYAALIEKARAYA